MLCGLTTWLMSRATGAGVSLQAISIASTSIMARIVKTLCTAISAAHVLQGTHLRVYELRYGADHGLVVPLLADYGTRLRQEILIAQLQQELLRDLQTMANSQRLRSHTAVGA